MSERACMSGINLQRTYYAKMSLNFVPNFMTVDEIK